ncbi:MAG: toll/interleukin-1 receptor domain-containing protein, partial [Actinomycetota bacterium]
EDPPAPAAAALGGADGASGGDDGSAVPWIIAAVLGLAAVAGGVLWWLARRAANAAPAAAALATAAAPAIAGAVSSDRVFVSYTTPNLERATRIDAAIEAAGIPTWFAQDDGAIPGGAIWKEQIVRGLRECDVMVILLSDQAVRSPHVATELSLAKSEGLDILPVMLHEGVELPDRMTYDLADVQWVLCPDDDPASHSAVVAALRGLLDDE